MNAAPLEVFAYAPDEKPEQFNGHMHLKIARGAGGVSMVRTVDILQDFMDEHADAPLETLDALGVRDAEPKVQLAELADANDRELDRFVADAAVKVVPHKNYREDIDDRPLLKMRTKMIEASPLTEAEAEELGLKHTGLALRYYRGVFDDFVHRLDDSSFPNRVFHKELVEPTQIVRGRLVTEPDAEPQDWLLDIEPDLVAIALDGEYGAELNPQFLHGILPTLGIPVYDSGDEKLVAEYESLIDYVDAEVGLDKRVVASLKQPVRLPTDFKQAA